MSKLLRKFVPYILLLVISLSTIIPSIFAKADGQQEQSATTTKPATIATELVVYSNTDIEDILPDLETVDEWASLDIEEEPKIETEVIEEVQEPTEITYIVQSGDSLWKIADKFYGDGNLYWFISQSNDMSSSSVIHPGNELKIPVFSDDIKRIEEIKEEPVVKASANSNTTVYKGSLSEVFNATSIEDYSNLTFFANSTITGYDPWCSHCCGKKYPDAITASGKVAVVGRSVGMTGLPLGTKIYVEGYGYFTVEDTGNVKKAHVDIAVASHSDAYKVTGRANVYIVNY